MERSHHVSKLRSRANVPDAELRQAALTTAVGASYSFDPGADGLASIYAARVLERGIDPRALCAEVRADRLGLVERGANRRALMSRNRATRFGRGTAAHLHTQAIADRSANVESPATEPRADRVAKRTTVRPRGIQGSLSRKMAAAGLITLLLLPLGVIAAGAQESPFQSRYIVQAGDTVETVAAGFGVDPAAILAASELLNPPSLTPAEVIVIPDPGESPDAAAWNAGQRQGASPFVAGAHEVTPGETFTSIGAEQGLDPWALASFNGISDIDDLSAGQRLRIPLTDTVVAPAEETPADWAPTELAWATDDTWVAEEQLAPEAVGSAGSGWEDPVSGPVFAADVPAYQPKYSLSCEYAAAYIATSAFG